MKMSSFIDVTCSFVRCNPERDYFKFSILLFLLQENQIRLFPDIYDCSPAVSRSPASAQTKMCQIIQRHFYLKSGRLHVQIKLYFTDGLKIKEFH